MFISEFGFVMFVVWAMVEVVCTFVWIFCGRLLLGLRAVGGFGFLVVVGEVWAMVEVVCTFVWIFCGRS